MLMSNMTYRTFIGYSSEDDKLAQYIHDCLERIVQIQPYKAEIYLEFGEDSKKKLQNELDNSYFMVALLTDKGMHSQWVNQEIGYAYALKRRLKLLPALRGLPHIIPISESQTKLKGFITKDTVDILFLDHFSCFEDVIANIIVTIRRHIPRGLEEGVLGIRITCSNCLNEKNLPFEYIERMPHNEMIRKTVELGPQHILRSTCPECQAKNDFDARTFLPSKKRDFTLM